MPQETISDPILAQYVQDKARKLGETPAEIAAQINRQALYDQVYALHERFMNGEFSFGYMAKLLEITKPDLYRLLDAMGLKVTNV